MKTNQEIFDAVSKHLLIQRTQAKGSDGECVYHGPDGLRCAVGCLIPRTVSTSAIEGTPVAEAFELAPALFAGLGIGKQHLGLLSRLQKIHDGNSAPDWPVDLMTVAETFHLQPSPELTAAAGSPCWLADRSLRVRA